MKFVFSILMLTSYSLLGQQSVLDGLPKPPNIASLGKYGDVPVSLSRGQLNYSIPLYDISFGDVNLPISLSYNNRGLKVADIPSWVGHGWDLIAGGAIIRQVIGLPDECPLGISKASVKEKLNNYYTNASWPTSEKQAFLNEAARSNIDTGYDIYTYSISGKTGKFYFDKDGIVRLIQASPIKITATPDLSSFTLIDELGSRFEFAFTQQSDLSYSPNFPATDDSQDLYQNGVNSWLLTKLVTPNKRVVNFTYQANGNINKSQSSRAVTLKAFDIYDGTVGQHCANLRSDNVSSRIVNTSEYVLQRIDFDLGSVVFDLGEERTDIRSCYNATFRTLGNISIYNKAQELIRQFSFTYGYFGGNARLKLSKIGLFGSASDENGDFQFSYINEGFSFPNFHNITNSFYSQDYWGYYNGKPNTTLVPDLAINEQYPNYYPPQNTWLANRNADPNFAKYGLLSQVKYPTGGITSFEYQSNQVSFGTANSGPIPHMFRKDFSTYESILDVEVPNNSGRTVSFTLTADTDIVVNALVSTTDINPGWLPPTIEFSGPTDFREKFWQSVEPISPGVARYSCYVPAAKIGTYSITMSTLTWEDIYNSHITLSVSRIGNPIRMFNADGMRISKISTCENNVCSIKKFLYVTPESIPLPQFISLYSTKSDDIYGVAPRCHFVTISDSPLNSTLGVEYEKVSELQEENGESGKTDYTFFPTYSISSIDQEPYAMPIHKTWAGGVLSEKLIFTKINSAYRLVRREKYNYESSYLRDNQIVNLITDNGLKVKLSHIGVDGFGLDSEFFVGLTPLYTEFYRNTGETIDSYSYDQIGQSTKLTQEVTKQYNNLEHLQVTNSNTISSDNSIRSKTYKYPLDNVSGLTIDALLAKDEMKMNNMVSYLLEVDELVNGYSVKLEKNGYKIQNGGIIGLSTYQVALAGNSPQLKAEYSKYDLKGNILEQKLIDGIQTCVLWGYKNTYPVALVKNATFSEVLSAMALVESDYNIEADLPMISNTLKTKIALLRNNLPKAQVQTFETIPLIGTSKIIDANNVSSYFNYDSMGRLQLVKDSNQNILSQYIYSLKK